MQIVRVLFLSALTALNLISCHVEKEADRPGHGSSSNDRFDYKLLGGVPIPYNFDNQLCSELGKNAFPKLSLKAEEEATPKDNPLVAHVIKYSVPQVSYPMSLSLVALPDGYLMSFRFDCTDQAPSRLQSYTLLAELDQNLEPRGHVQILDRPTVADSQKKSHTAEDLRLFSWKGEIWGLSNDNLDGLDMTWETRRQVLYRMEKANGRWFARDAVQYQRPKDSAKTGAEKDWMPLSLHPKAESLMFNSSLNRPIDHISASVSPQSRSGNSVDTNLAYRCDTFTPWAAEKWGEMHGGTPAIWLKDEQKYLSFFHSVEALPSEGKRYHMGAVLISPDNFCVTEVSPSPLSYAGIYGEKKGFWVNLAGPDSELVFPMGLVDGIYKNEASLLLSLGVNDSSLKIAVLKRKETLASLQNADVAMTKRLQQGRREILSGHEKEAFDAYVQKHKITVSMTTSPTRIKFIKPILDAISQESLISRIYLALPLRYGKNKEVYTIPAWLNLTNYPKLKILNPPEDFGPLSKMIFAVRDLRDEGELDAVVISVDDDTGYPGDTFAQLVKAIALQPNTVFGGSTQPLKFWGFDDNQVHHWKSGRESLVIEGFGAVAYPVSLVDHNVMEDIVKANRYCFASDDLAISFVLDRSGITRSRVTNGYMGADKIFQYTWGFGQDALHKGAGLEERNSGNLNTFKYQQCNQYLESAYSN